MSSTITHQTVGAEYFVIAHKRSGAQFSDAWYNHRTGRWTAQLTVVPEDVTRFPTKDAALDAFRTYRFDPRVCGIARIAPKVALTEAGRESVAARRAARNAERKF